MKVERRFADDLRGRTPRRGQVPTLLIIDDSAVHRKQVVQAIEPAQIFDQVVEAEDGLKGLKFLLNQPVDVVLCDLEMPALDGEKLLRVKEAAPGSNNVPFVFLTASTDLERRIRLLEGGAADLIVKPFHPGELVARLRLHLKVKRLQDELRVKNESLALLSTTDALTGLRTRRYTQDVLSIEFLRARRYRSPLSVMMADIDDFKSVNDGHGHPGGDTVLRGMASLLLSQLRATDVAGRYGGDEVLVILAQSELDGAGLLAERWRQAMESTSFEAPDAQAIEATVSIGVATYDASLKSPEELVAAADAALYRAKEKGRNRVEAAEPEVD
jgi:two-component system cell cycle response regulator